MQEESAEEIDIDLHADEDDPLFLDCEEEGEEDNAMSGVNSTPPGMIKLTKVNEINQPMSSKKKKAGVSNQRWGGIIAVAKTTATAARPPPPPPPPPSSLMKFILTSAMLNEMIEREYSVKFQYVTGKRGVRAFMPPLREHELSTTWTLFCAEEKLLQPGKKALFPLGLKFHFSNNQMRAKIEDRSSIACVHGLRVLGSGGLDASLVHPAAVTIKNDGNTLWKFTPGAAICSLIFTPFHHVKLEPYSDVERDDWLKYGGPVAQQVV